MPPRWVQGQRGSCVSGSYVTFPNCSEAQRMEAGDQAVCWFSWCQQWVPGAEMSWGRPEAVGEHSRVGEVLVKDSLPALPIPCC